MAKSKVSNTVSKTSKESKRKPSGGLSESCNADKKVIAKPSDGHSGDENDSTYALSDDEEIEVELNINDPTPFARQYHRENFKREWGLSKAEATENTKQNCPLCEPDGNDFQKSLEKIKSLKGLLNDESMSDKPNQMIVDSLVEKISEMIKKI